MNGPGRAPEPERGLEHGEKAGTGNYGGGNGQPLRRIKQIDPVDHDGDLIIDFSIFDAKEAGFEKVVFIIKKAIEKDFREHIGNRMEKHIQVEYVYQENDLLPEGYQVPVPHGFTLFSGT